MNGWFLIIWLTLLLAFGLIGFTIELTDWQPSGYHASTHDDPSPGPNSLF